ncbi:DNA replication/repair protein RecF [Limibaculum sp. FT325]|uniref:DNA replication/repair protein RecF n=1 Tax=Thermohalobaculum sediminis TaxID=2939436 RepID=UPI0020BF175A|nr:DNA replication/repair protein RecF [Limibaculum sediminis]MCL5777673.1 DNA replication/repair protein RecF [Limibaculum sediminis]
MSRSAILSLRLAQFRSYDAATVETGGASVALHGPNGAGKTNLLEAVSMLSPGRGLRRAGAEEIPRRGGPGWRIRAEVETPTAEVEIVTGVEGEGETRRSVEIDGKPAPQTRLAELVGMVWLTPAMDRLWTEGATERRGFLDRLTMGFTPSHAEAATGYEKAMRARNRLLREPPWDDAWLGGIEAQMARLGARIARARAAALIRLVAAQRGAQTLFPRADLAILGDMETRFHQALAEGGDPDTLEAEEAAGLARALALGRARDAAAGRTLDGPHRSDLEAVYAEKAMPARACSTGEQKALLISLVLGHARALAEATGAAPILLLDEVAAHLDAGRRHALHAEIGALGAQAWMTGTGPELFDGLDGARMIAVSESDGRSHLAAA